MGIPAEETCCENQLSGRDVAKTPSPSRLTFRKGIGEKYNVLKTSVKLTFSLTDSTIFYLLVMKKAKTEELFIASFFHTRGKMAEEFLVINCLQLFSVQGKVVRCERR